uniref:Uncharacterized protein n=1 Tax=Panagrolaimus davidi TaxID=227884 RepID=A0A914PTU7_9BILA
MFLEFLNETNYIIEESHSALVKVLEWPAFIVLMQIGAWIDQVINGPWWSYMDSDKHIIEQNISSAKMINYLEQVAENPILFKDDSIFPMITERSVEQIALRDTVLSNVSDTFIDIMPNFCKDLAEYLNKQLNALLEDAIINDEANREMLASASVIHYRLAELLQQLLEIKIEQWNL